MPPTLDDAIANVTLCGEWLLDIDDGAAAHEPDQLAAATYERLRDASQVARLAAGEVAISDLRNQLAEAHGTITLLRALVAAADAPTPPAPAPAAKVHSFPANALRHTSQRIGLLVR